MNSVFLVRNKWSGEVLGVYSTIELAKENQPDNGVSYIEELPLDVPLIKD